MKAIRFGGIAFLLTVATASPALAQSMSGNGAGMIGGGGVGALSSGGAGMIGGPGARSGTRGGAVVQLPDNQPHNPAPPPPVGAGYGTPGNVGNLGAASNSGVGAGVLSDIHSGIPTSPNLPPP